MSRRGNCHDNAVTESFFQLLKRERIRRKTYGTREKSEVMCPITLRCFITPSDGTAALCSYRQWSLKSAISRAWRVSRKTGAIHTYGVLYGTEKLSNKKDWHILRNIKQKSGSALTISPDGQWSC